MPTLQHLLPGALCALVVAAGGCKEEEPTKLFEEKGTWALFQYDIDGSGITPIDLQERVDKFLINYDPDTAIVSAASCIDSMDRIDITEALCDIDKFVCRCFSYTYDESSMVWTELTIDGQPPPPQPPEESPAVKPGEPYAIQLEAYPETNGTYRYSGLPYGLFSSDGEISRYVFQVRGDSLFIETGCLEICGATVPGGAPEEM